MLFRSAHIPVVASFLAAAGTSAVRTWAGGPFQAIVASSLVAGTSVVGVTGTSAIGATGTLAAGAASCRGSWGRPAAAVSGGWVAGKPPLACLPLVHSSFCPPRGHTFTN